MMSWPPPPREEMLGMMEEDEVAELWLDLITELLDQRYAGRIHGSRKTYDSGCMGPLCRKATREHSRRRQNSGMSEQYRYIDPLLDFWAPIAKMRIDLAMTVVRRQLIE